jgi:hypothetical protein
MTVNLPVPGQRGVSPESSAKEKKGIFCNFSQIVSIDFIKMWVTINVIIQFTHGLRGWSDIFSKLQVM